jgi:hypothetical protein
LEFCGWFPVEGICHDRRIEALSVITTPEECGTAADGGIGNNGGNGGGNLPSGGYEAGSRPCILTTLGLFAVPLGAILRRRSG